MQSDGFTEEYRGMGPASETMGNDHFPERVLKRGQNHIGAPFAVKAYRSILPHRSG